MHPINTVTCSLTLAKKIKLLETKNSQNQTGKNNRSKKVLSTESSDKFLISKNVVE